jgi:hypothetical protein
MRMLLNGKIIRHEDMSYLVLHDNESTTEWLRVKSICPKPEVKRMRREDLQRSLTAQK